MEYLYLLIQEDNLAYKVGITNDLQSRLRQIEKDFGKVSKSNSIIYSCKNRKLIEKIEGGIHAYLNNESYNPLKIGGGATEWFQLHSFNKCISFIDLYVNELKEFRQEGILSEILERKENFEEVITELDDSRTFYNIHTQTVQELHSLIAKQRKQIVFEEKEGLFVLLNMNNLEFGLQTLPVFNWVNVESDRLEFKIDEYNKWKQSGRYKEMREVVGIKYFDKYTLTHLDEMFKE
nr:GIY-YIG nuclease family protein [uncultured Carboxylicivirga sp.]